MPEAKHHHWWPIAHSKHWVNEKGFIRAVRKAGPPFLGKPEKIGKKRRHNSIQGPDGVWDQYMEDAFARVIDNAIPSVMSILARERTRLPGRFYFNLNELSRAKPELRRDGFEPPTDFVAIDIDDLDKAQVAQYVAAMLVRVPSYKDQLNGSRMIEQVAAQLKVQTSEALQIADITHLHVIDRHINEYAEKLTQYEWIFIEPPEGEEFLFCDAPVLPSQRVGEDCVVFFPILPRLALAVFNKWKSPRPNLIQIYKIRTKLLKFYNKALVLNAGEVVFGRAPFSVNFVQKHLGEGQVRIVPDISIQGADQAGQSGIEIGVGPMVP